LILKRIEHETLINENSPLTPNYMPSTDYPPQGDPSTLGFVCEFGGEGRERLGKKMNEQVEEIEENERRELWGVNFSS